MKSLLIISVLLLLFSCNQNKKNDKNLPEKTTDSILETNEADENGVQVVENNVLVSDMCESLALESKKNKYIIEKEAISNEYYPKLMDTIKTFKFNNDHIEYYKTKDKQWLTGAKLITPDIEIINGIKIGVNKNDLEKILGIAIYSETVKLENEEHTNAFTFKFKSNILMEIEYEGYVD